MKNLTQKFIGLFALVFAMNLIVNAQEKNILIYTGPSGEGTTQSELALILYQKLNSISIQVTTQELYAARLQSQYLHLM